MTAHEPHKPHKWYPIARGVWARFDICGIELAVFPFYVDPRIHDITTHANEADYTTVVEHEDLPTLARFLADAMT